MCVWVCVCVCVCLCVSERERESERGRGRESSLLPHTASEGAGRQTAPIYISHPNSAQTALHTGGQPIMCLSLKSSLSETHTELHTHEKASGCYQQIDPIKISVSHHSLISLFPSVSRSVTFPRSRSLSPLMCCLPSISRLAAGLSEMFLTIFSL